MKKLIWQFFFLFVLLFSDTALAQRESCVRNQVCGSCEGGRAYTLVGGSYCTPCIRFCVQIQDVNGQVEPLSDPRASVVNNPEHPGDQINPRILNVRVEKDLIRAIAEINPEAAVFLTSVNERAGFVDNTMPTVGVAGSPFLVSREHIWEFLHAGSIAKPMPASAHRGARDDHSWIQYRLEKVRNGYVLRISHVLGERISMGALKLYPDISVQVIRSATGSRDEFVSGAWEINY